MIRVESGIEGAPVADRHPEVGDSSKTVSFNVEGAVISVALDRPGRDQKSAVEEAREAVVRLAERRTRPQPADAPRACPNTFAIWAYRR